MGRIVGLIIVLVAVAGSAAWYGTTSARHTALEKAQSKSDDAITATSLRRLANDELVVPADVANRMNLKTATAHSPSTPKALPAFSGTLSVDNNVVSRVYSRFPGELVSFGTVNDPATGERPLRYGDPVNKGQKLAIVSSTVLGEKKSELVDALSKLHRDEKVLAALNDPSTSGSVPPRSIVDAERDVESDRVAISKAERTLISWKITDEEMNAIRTEASELAKGGARRPDSATWSLSTIVSPRDGILLQRDTNATAMVDTNTPLFFVADLSHLAVWVHVYEEDLPLLQALPRPIQWTVNVPSQPGTSFSGTLDSISAVIHPDQHTALVSGVVANPNGTLYSGMFVTVTVALPPTRGEIEIPAEALIEDGRDSVVFVRSSSNPSSIVRHRVKVARRFRDVVYLAAGIHANDEVITSGSLLLNEAMNELRAGNP